LDGGSNGARMDIGAAGKLGRRRRSE
jgi:hypothetical protein